MSPSSEPQPSRVLTAAELVNERIRAFMLARPDRPLHTDESAAYQRLLEDWAAATRADVIPAA